jgi:hypothetical protein
MGHSVLLAMMLLTILGFLSQPTALEMIPYGTRSKCYRVVSKVVQTLANTAFCKTGPLGEVHVCARNIDDANARVLKMETEVRGLNQATCNLESQNVCKSLGFTQGGCPNAPQRCKMPFKNECSEDADCKAPVSICCQTCEEDIAALNCVGLTERLKDAYCQVSFMTHVF